METTAHLVPGDVVSVKWHQSTAKVVEVRDGGDAALIRWPTGTVSEIGAWRLEKVGHVCESCGQAHGRCLVCKER